MELCGKYGALECDNCLAGRASSHYGRQTEQSTILHMITQIYTRKIGNVKTELFKYIDLWIVGLMSVGRCLYRDPGRGTGMGGGGGTDRVTNLGRLQRHKSVSHNKLGRV